METTVVKGFELTGAEIVSSGSALVPPGRKRRFRSREES